MGDFIGVFYDDNGTLKCAGACAWNASSNISLHAWGDDIYTSGKQGFTTGEFINWKVYHEENSQEYVADVTYQIGCSGCTCWDGLWYNFGLSALASLEGNYYDLVLQNITINNLETFCYDALHNIHVAGNGTSVIVEEGGELFLIAGNNILLKTGFHAQSGSYFHGYISDAGCTAPFQPVTVPVTDNEQITYHNEDQGKETTTDELNRSDYLKIYPNPTTGKLIIELYSIVPQKSNTIWIFDRLGKRIHQQEVRRPGKTELDFTPYPDGIYLVRVLRGAKPELVKVVKQ
ncbi:MAG: T9SS type A sorting domain-containing protein [Bacteroidales bacterium]|nr:T9SS type A sorting domain-containing protein [Lentimicrobiaceae bacterium]MDD5695847.1 T9SS type A sorting domain-containing protein [Bacteroidales bacterium]